MLLTNNYLSLQYIRMKEANLRKFLLGSILTCGLTAGAHTCCAQKTEKDDEWHKTEIDSSAVQQKDIYGNTELFEKSRSKIKFALAFVENYYPYIYWCGEAWTTGHGLTVLYDTNGTYKSVTPSTQIPTLQESDMYEDRYLTYEVLQDIKNCVTVSMDESTLLAACVLRYCIGGPNFRVSEFLKQLNAGKTGVELAKTLTGWRQQAGVPNRCYFFAGLMVGAIEFEDLLDLRAEGCYALNYRDMFVHHKGRPKSDANGFYEWDFSKVQENLSKAKRPRTVCLKLGKKKGFVLVRCKLAQEIVSQSVWDDVNNRQVLPAEHKNTRPPIGPIVLGVLGAGAALTYYRKKQHCH